MTVRVDKLYHTSIESSTHKQLLDNQEEVGVGSHYPTCVLPVYAYSREQFHCENDLIPHNVAIYLRVGITLKWLVSQAPYLIHESTKAPHITGSGVLLVV